MEQFVYSDIFATKGIEYLVVIAFLLLLIPFWISLNKPLKTAVSEAGAAFLSLDELLKLPQGIFFSPKHTWSHLEKSGNAAVGVDGLLLHLTGGVDIRFLKKQHDKVRKGEALAVLSNGDKEMHIKSPLSGTITARKDSLEKQPEELLLMPYDTWLVKLAPENWGLESRDEVVGAAAGEWAKEEMSRFKDFFAEASSSGSHPAPILQDGGELSAELLKDMDQDTWQRFEERFL